MTRIAVDAQVRGPSRRSVLRGATAAGLGVTSLALPQATAAASSVFTTGLGDGDLAMYLDATNTSSWSGSGNWTDLTGNNRSLEPGGPMSFSDSGLGITGGTGAFVFDGTGGRAPTTAVPAFAYAGDWTLAVWARHSSLSGWQSYISQGDAQANALYFQKANDTIIGTETTTHGTGRAANRPGVVMDRPTDDLFCYDTTALTTGRWYHLVLTGTTEAVRMHVDGSLVATASTGGSGNSLASGSGSTVVGNRWDDLGDPLRGALAFVQIWTRALTTAEVSAQYAATRAPYHPS